MSKVEYTVKLGAQLIIWITGDTRRFVAEITKVDPLEMKVMEEGPYAHLKDGDYIIIGGDSAHWQEGGKKKRTLFQRAELCKNPLLSALQSLGVTDGKLHEILPNPEAPSSKQDPSPEEGNAG